MPHRDAASLVSPTRDGQSKYRATPVMPPSAPNHGNNAEKSHDRSGRDN